MAGAEPSQISHRHGDAGAVMTIRGVSPAPCHGPDPCDGPDHAGQRPAAASHQPTPAAGTTFTCPMHPDISQDGPGACPICGMALEPAIAAAEPATNPELIDMTRRFWIALALAAPVIALDMGGHLAPLTVQAVAPAGWPAWTQAPAGWPAWIELLFATPVVIWAGFPFFQRAWASVARRNMNMFSLIALGTGSAYLYSLAAVLAPGWFPAGFRGHDGGVAVYFEAASAITVLVLLGQVLELRAREQTGGAIRALLNLAPKIARRIGDKDQDEDIPLAEVRQGDRLRVRPGEAVPVDGTVLAGAGAVDESMVTGEAMPVAKQPGDGLIGGTVNGTGAMVMRAERVGADTVLARIVAMVAEAQRSRAPIQLLADRVAGWFVPGVLAVAAVAFAAWAWFGPAPALSYGLIAAVSVLIIACPCALGLATPVSLGVGVGQGARAGVLIRSAEALERMERVDTLVVDKTGTLTEGKPRVVAILAAPGLAAPGLAAPGLAAPGLAAPGLAAPGLAAPGLAAPGLAAPGLAAPGLAAPGLAAPGLAAPGLAAPGLAAPGLAAPGLAAPGLAEADLLRLAASLERSSEHPIAAAILACARDRGMVLADPSAVTSIAGRGVTGVVDGHAVALGNRALMDGLEISLDALIAAQTEGAREGPRRDAATAVFLAVDGAAAAVIAIADPIKPTTRAALDRLRADGIRIVMLSGDNATTAKAIGRILAIDEVHGDVTPAGKQRIVRDLRSAGRIVAMAGDGVNDAPALAEADVGIAMGAGTEVAIQSAGITLVKGDLMGIARARTISRATMRNIRGNLAFAFAYNAIGIPVAAGVLYPWFGITLSPIVAALAMSLSSVSVIGNALRLRRVRL